MSGLLYPTCLTILVCSHIVFLNFSLSFILRSLNCKADYLGRISQTYFSYFLLINYVLLDWVTNQGIFVLTKCFVGKKMRKIDWKNYKIVSKLKINQVLVYNLLPQLVSIFGASTSSDIQIKVEMIRI